MNHNERRETASRLAKASVTEWRNGDREAAKDALALALSNVQNPNGPGWLHPTEAYYIGSVRMARAEWLAFGAMEVARHDAGWVTPSGAVVREAWEAREAWYNRALR